MTDLIVKSAARESLENKNVAADFFEDLNGEVEDLIEVAAERAKANDRKTVQPRDL